MSLFHDLRRQPLRIRQIMFGLALVTILLGVGMVWLNSFQKNMYALLNPSSEATQAGRALAGGPASASSPLELISRAFGGLRASLADIFSGTGLLLSSPTVSPAPAGPGLKFPVVPAE